MLKVAICDDEEVAIDIMSARITHYLDQEKASYELYPFTDALALRNEILNGEAFQVLFLDIDMPSLNGIRLGEHLRRSGFTGYVIFTTSRADQVFDSLRVQPFRFIRKSKFNEEIGIAIHDLLEEMAPKKQESMVFQRGNQVFQLNPYDIMYVESQRKLQYVHLPVDVAEISSGMEDLCTRLEPFGFLRIHKSYAVNYRFIHAISGTDVILDNKEILPVSRQRLKEVKLQFQRLALHG